MRATATATRQLARALSRLLESLAVASNSPATLSLLAASLPRRTVSMG